jgi:hypothetical protein
MVARHNKAAGPEVFNLGSFHSLHMLCVQAVSVGMPEENWDEPLGAGQCCERRLDMCEGHSAMWECA